MKLTPPLNQKANGAVSGFLRAAKNQNLCEAMISIMMGKQRKGRFHQILCDEDKSLINAGRGLAWFL